jgi:hypothetical protein
MSLNDSSKFGDLENGCNRCLQRAAECRPPCLTIIIELGKENKNKKKAIAKSP